MKKLLILSAIALFASSPKISNAQINVNVNIGAQPLWGPTGYERVDYYYLPDIETYYSVPERKYIYQNNGDWIHSTLLPANYRSYNLYNGYKVVVNRPNPYLNFASDKVKYQKYKGVRTQPVIIRSTDSRYYVIKGHPHGMPPGQAKKIYGNKGVSVKNRQVISTSNGKNKKSEGNHGNGKSKGKGKD